MVVDIIVNLIMMNSKLRIIYLGLLWFCCMVIKFLNLIVVKVIK